MKRKNYSALARLILTLVACSALSVAASLTEAEKKEGLAQLDRTRAGVLEAVKGLSEAQWKFKSDPSRWSVAEVLEHIAVTEDFLFERITGEVMKGSAPKPDRDIKSVDKFILTAITDRTQKFQAPEPVVPKARWSPQEALDHFQQSRARTADFLNSTAGLRDHVLDSPLGQPFDAYQWLLFISAHSERHTKQMLEVKADPKFPKK